jgi:glycosyltransferase involved in cell wall biosynthesis
MPQPLVTALIDTFNHERFIGEAIESVLSQDFPARSMEIVVVDDGSTDRTPQRVKKFAKRIRYVRKKNGGQASALNLGFASSRGDIVVMLDGDDVWLPHKVRRVVEEFEKNPAAGMVFHPYQFWQPDEDCQEDDLTFLPVSGYLPDSPIAMRQFGGFGTCSTAIRRKLAAELLPIPPRLKIFADCYLIAAAIFLAPVASMPECLTRYRHHEANLASILQPDQGRLAQRNVSFRAAREEIERWLAGRGFDQNHPAADTILRRMELVQRTLDFSLQSPGRAKYFAYLRDHHRVYSLLWKAPRRLLNRFTTLAGLILGYEKFLKLRQIYSE